MFGLFKKSDDNSKAVVKQQRAALSVQELEGIVSSIVLQGDISKLNPSQRVAYVKEVCGRLGIDWSTQPFQILRLNGKERLYATKDATDQLRKLYGVSIIKLEKTMEQGLCVFIAHARDRSGKEDTSSGAVAITGLSGEQLANAIMKAETKAKRRVTLSICGLGMLDENEIDSIQGAEVKNIEHTEVKVLQTPAAPPKAERTPTVEELHDQVMELLNEYSEYAGVPAAQALHPQSWKAREVKNYLAAIPAIREKIKAVKEGKEVVHG